MNILYDEQHTKTDTYCYDINGGGEFFITESGKVTIIFDNGVFASVTFPFSGLYSRNGWRILAAINEKITEIEQALKPKG